MRDGRSLPSLRGGGRLPHDILVADSNAIEAITCVDYVQLGEYKARVPFACFLKASTPMLKVSTHEIMLSLDKHSLISRSIRLSELIIVDGRHVFKRVLRQDVDGVAGFGIPKLGAHGEALPMPLLWALTDPSNVESNTQALERRFTVFISSNLTN